MLLDGDGAPAHGTGGAKMGETMERRRESLPLWVWLALLLLALFLGAYFSGVLMLEKMM
jgi:hypothetical protein